MAGVRMCSTMSKLQEKRVYVVRLLRVNQHGAGLQEAAVGCWACPSQQAWDGQAASWAWSRANQKLQNQNDAWV